MREYLVFQLYGPLASWGDIAVGETRTSSLTPSKSAVLGMFAAALGLKRPDTARNEQERADWEARHAALARGYGLAVKVEALGMPLTDYHTAQVPSSGSGHNRVVFPTRRDELTWVLKYDLNTVLSRRDYRQDAYAVCALWARAGAPYDLARLRDALLSPKFVLYLGRKACPPALPLAPQIVTAGCVEDALAFLNLKQALETIAPRHGEKLARGLRDPTSWLLWDSDGETRVAVEQSVTRRDHPLSRRRWQYSVRVEHRAHLLADYAQD